MDTNRQAEQAIEEMVRRETLAWDQKDSATLVDLFHPDMVWPWPPTEHDHDPATWVLTLGRYDRERWKRGWEQLFSTHQLIHNHREIHKIVVSDEGDGGFAVVDINTLWRGQSELTIGGSAALCLQLDPDCWQVAFYCVLQFSFYVAPRLDRSTI
jgi:hypothetical protein